MGLVQNERVDWANIQQIYSDLNEARERFNFTQYDLQDNNSQYEKVTTDPIFTIKGLLEEMKTNAYVGQVADTSDIEVPNRGTLITPKPLLELSDVVSEINKVCNFATNSGCFSFTRTNFSCFAGVVGNPTNFSGFNSSNVSGFNSSNYSSFRSTWRSSSFNSSHRSTHRSAVQSTHRSGNFSNVSSFFSSNHASFSFNASYSNSSYRPTSNTGNFASFHGTFNSSGFNSGNHSGFRSAHRSDSSRSFTFTGSYRS